MTEQPIIHEHTLLQIRSGQSAAFEAAFDQARPLIAASPGFISIAVQPAADTPGLYLLTVAWTDIAAHRDGFRRSDRYREWRTLLHPFYDPILAITYFGPSIL